jgi:hypothetical protein
VDELDKSSQCIASGNVARECPPEAELVRPQLQHILEIRYRPTKPSSAILGSTKVISAEVDDESGGLVWPPAQPGFIGSSARAKHPRPVVMETARIKGLQRSARHRARGVAVAVAEG